MYTILREKIHQSMILNTDQIVVVLVSVRDDLNCKVKSSKQELMNGKDQKRAFICITSMAKKNKVLATQSI